MNDNYKSLIKQSVYYKNFTVITKSIITFKDHDMMLIWSSLIPFFICSLSDVSINAGVSEPICIMADWREMNRLVYYLIYSSP